jgi:hypothetical protein
LTTTVHNAPLKNASVSSYSGKLVIAHGSVLPKVFRTFQNYDQVARTITVRFASLVDKELSCE